MRIVFNATQFRRHAGDSSSLFISALNRESERSGSNPGNPV